MNGAQISDGYNNEEIPSHLDAIFKEYSQKAKGHLLEVVERGWAFPKLRYGKELLFVGINPSFRDNKDRPGNLPYDLFIKENQVTKDRHFSHFFELADSLNAGDNWTYLDLFYFREKHQEIIESFIQDAEGKNFICAQLQLTFDIMNSLAPKVIVVCNARIHDFFGRNIKGEMDAKRNVWMGFKFEKNESTGIERIKEIESDFIKVDVTSFQLKGTSVIFSSSLSTKYMRNEEKKERAENLKQKIQLAFVQ